MKKAYMYQLVVMVSLWVGISSAAQAKAVLLMSGDMEGQKYSEFEYVLDQQTGQVNVELKFQRVYTCGGAVRSSDFPVDCYHSSQMVVSVPGLVVDAETGLVVYGEEGSDDVTACAVVKKERGLFGSKTVVKSTGLCGVTAHETMRSTEIYFNSQD